MKFDKFKEEMRNKGFVVLYDGAPFNEIGSLLKMIDMKTFEIVTLKYAVPDEEYLWGELETTEKNIIKKLKGKFPEKEDYEIQEMIPESKEYETIIRELIEKRRW